MNSGANSAAENSDTPSRFPNLPERIRGLERLSYNLWWSWQPHARELFRSLDLPAWRAADHNPLRMLTLLPQQVLEDAAKDPILVKKFDALMAEFDANI